MKALFRVACEARVPPLSLFSRARLGAHEKKESKPRACRCCAPRFRRLLRCSPVSSRQFPSVPSSNVTRADEATSTMFKPGSWETKQVKGEKSVRRDTAECSRGFSRACVGAGPWLALVARVALALSSLARSLALWQPLFAKNAPTLVCCAPSFCFGGERPSLIRSPLATGPGPARAQKAISTLPERIENNF